MGTANTLTNLIPTIETAADTVSRELTGLIPAVTRNSSAARAALAETIRFPVVPAYTPAAITSAATGPDPSDSDIGSDTMSISSSESVTFWWNGEEQRGLNNAGYYNQILRDQFTQAMRALVNKIELELAGLYVYASRAYGTAATTPFGTAGDYTDGAYVRKILVDNGAPTGDLQLVVSTGAGANLRGKQGGRGVDAEGSSDLLRRGVLLDIHGFMVRESAQIKAHTKGGGTGYDFASGGEAIGQTTLTLEGGTVNSTGFKAGDIVTHAGDSVNKYVVKTGLTATSGDIVIGAPGLLVAGVDANELTIGNSYTANLAFSRSAIHLITRAPAMPAGGDAADDVIEVQDPVSGLAFQIAMYRQRRRVAYEVGIAWGSKAVKPEHIAILLG
ncbi:MAG: hypothetical protein RLZZ524_3108 [Pseudomonadota bacterium]|jgi:hypothetical protein